jgi:hypothetical protein
MLFSSKGELSHKFHGLMASYLAETWTSGICQQLTSKFITLSVTQKGQKAQGLTEYKGQMHPTSPAMMLQYHSTLAYTNMLLVLPGHEGGAS